MRDSAQCIVRLLPYLKHLWRSLGLFLLITLAGAGLGVIPALLQGKMIDALLRLNVPVTLELLGVSSLISLIGVALSLSQQRTTLQLSHRISEALREEAIRRLQRGKYAKLSGYGLGQFMNRIEGDVEGVAAALLSLTPIFSAVATLGWVVIVMPLLSAPLALISYAFIPLWLSTIVPLAPKVARFGLELASARDAFVTMLAERLSMAGLIRAKSFVQYDGDLRKILESYRNFLAIRLKQYRAERSTSILQAMIMGVGPGIVMLVGVYLVAHHQCTIGTVVAFSALFGRLFSPVGQIAGLGAKAMTVSFNAQRLIELFDIEHELSEGVDTLLTPPLKCSRLTFGYGDAPVLSDVSFCIEPKGRLVIQGPSGVGKSTLGRILMKYHDVPRGSITLGGVDLADWAPDALRSQIGYVPQDAPLLTGSLRENITYGRSFADEAVMSAVRVCQLEEFLQDHGGLDGSIDGQSIRISGGQRQRIALARALVGMPTLLILDEATSALDARTEGAVFSALLERFSTSTLVVIAHRIPGALSGIPVLTLQSTAQSRPVEALSA